MSHENELQQAITAIKSGDRKTASQLLTSIIKANPRNETAWLYLASIQTDINKQHQCLEQVLKLNPNNEAAKKRITQIENLQQSEVVPQTQIVQPSAAPQDTQDVIASTEPKESEKPLQSESEQSSASVVKDDKKRCPFCAETIKKEAKVCRYCGKDLTEQKKIKPIQQGKSDSQLINEFIAEKTKQGWVVVSQTSDSVQMKKPKRWSVLGLVLGFVLLIAFGAGLIILLLTVLDYALKKEKTLFITAAEIREKQKGKAQKRGQTGEVQKGYSTLLILGIMGAVGIILFLCIGFALISGSPSSNTTQPKTKNTPTRVKPTPTPIVYDWKGEGDDVIFFEAPSTGSGFMSAWYGGDGNFAVKLYRSDGKYIDLLVNTMDEYEGQTSYRINTPGQYYLEVNASGYDYKPKWHIVMAPPQ